MSAGRTLRSREDRLLLYEAANGLCQLCGVPLGESWHADHVVPWSITHRTNVFEMQALCATCNQRKGATAMQSRETVTKVSFPWDAVLSRMRRGQAEGIQVVRERFLLGERSSALIIPTRYGKTDMMRVIAMGLEADGAVCVSLMLSPNELLRDQAARKDKWHDCTQRYGLPPWLRYRPIHHPELAYTTNGEAFLSLTVQLLVRNIDRFVKWAEAETRRTGKPGIVFVDETQNYSHGNIWGSAAVKLMAIGWHVVLLTATAWRDDGESIPGFNWEVVDETSITFRKYRRDAETHKKWVDTYDGVARLVYLKADYEVTFKEAWDERPSPLCKISRVPYEVQLSQLMDGDSWSGLLLSQLSTREARLALGKVVRDPLVIREGVQRLLTELRIRRAVHPTIGALVFCGNDTDPEKRVNDHARAIARAITKYDPSLRVVIATVADGGAGKEAIEAFVKTPNPVGDVLIVKQMASVGLDAPRVKVLLDLSTVRTVSAFIQRIMRAATPFDGIKHATYITVDDVIGRDLFVDMIESAGGKMTTKEGDLVSTREVIESTDPDDRPIWLIDDTRSGDFQDHAGNVGLADRQNDVRVLYDRFPELSMFYTWPEMAGRMRDFDIVERAESIFETADDLETQILDAWDNIRVACKRTIDARVAQSRASGPEYRDVYAQTASDVWNEVKRAAGAPLNAELKHITDIGLLRRMEAEAEFRAPVIDDVE